MFSPKCLWKTSATHDVPLNRSQHFQRIFLGMLGVSGWTQGWATSSSPPGSAPRPKPSPGSGFPAPSSHQCTTLSAQRCKSQFFPKNHLLFQVFPGKCLTGPPWTTSEIPVYPKLLSQPRGDAFTQFGNGMFGGQRSSELLPPIPSRTGKPGAGSSLFPELFLSLKSKKVQKCVCVINSDTGV